jgi:hypothetical protein
VLLALFCISASAIAAEPTAQPKDAATSKSSGSGVRQVLVADPALPRVLLIGDSILSGYHGKAAELLRSKVNLDVWITPKHIGVNDLPTDMLAQEAVTHITQALDLAGPSAPATK